MSSTSVGASQSRRGTDASGLLATLAILALVSGRVDAQPQVRASLAISEVQPTVATRVAPVLPPGSTAEGIVRVELVVDQRGRVVAPRVVSGLGAATDSAVLAAVRQWTFRAARTRGETVAVLIGVRFQFHVPTAAHDGPLVSADMELLEAEPLPEPAPPIATVPENVEIDNPRAIRSITPRYTESAMRRRVQGTALMEIVILPDGTVGSARILKSLDAVHGLDREALIAARYWLFTPPMHMDVPVARAATLELSFSIH